LQGIFVDLIASVYFGVWTGSLNRTDYDLSFKGYLPTAPFVVMMEGDVWGKFLKLKKKLSCACTPVGGCVPAFVCVYGTVMSS